MNVQEGGLVGVGVLFLITLQGTHYANNDCNYISGSSLRLTPDLSLMTLESLRGGLVRVGGTRYANNDCITFQDVA